MTTRVQGLGVGEWLRGLEADDRSAHTIRSYAGAVKRFLQWYEAEVQKGLELADLTPVTLVGYRNELQHRQGKATASVNTELAALRSWCERLFDHGYLPNNPAARLRTVGRQGQPAPKGLDDRQVNSLLRERVGAGMRRVTTRSCMCCCRPG